MLASLGPINQITSRIIAGAIEVHRALGPGLLESVYHACLLYELRLAGLKVESQKKIPVAYKGVLLDLSYVLDLLIEDKVIAEVKCVEMVMKDGITRKLNRQALDI